MDSPSSFLPARGGSLTLWRVSLAGGTPAALTTGAGEDTEPDVSADGKKLIYSTQRKSWSLILWTRRPVRKRKSFPVGFGSPFQLLSQGRSGRIQSTGGGWRGPTARQFSGWARGPASHPGRAGAEHRAAVVRRWSLALFLPALPTKSFRKISVEGGTSSEVAPLDFRNREGRAGRPTRSRDRVFDH